MATYEVTDFVSFKTVIKNAVSGDVINVSGNVIQGTGETIATDKALTLNVANNVKLENLKIDGENITWEIAEYGKVTLDGDCRVTAKTFNGNYSNVELNIASVKETNITYINLRDRKSVV